MPEGYVCPSCESTHVQIFYEVQGIPVHSVLLLFTREEALNFPQGDVRLGFCSDCGFITNFVFNPSLHDYSSRYESTQSFSPTFRAFSRRIAQHLIDRYELRGKRIIEIGCGQGEFLTMLCELGRNEGIGFDPAYRKGPIESQSDHRMTFIKDYYSEKYLDYQADLFCCKMTLEHIPDIADFVRMVRRSIGDQLEAVVFFQVPDVVRILKAQAFWDIFYEHCSYFSLGSLARLIRRCGFDVVDLWKDFDEQYLLIEARPGDGSGLPLLSQEQDLDELAELVSQFSHAVSKNLVHWRQRLQNYHQNGQKVVIWGASSKGVAFLTTLKIVDEIGYAVDINPNKRDSFIPGTGQKIVSPDFLKAYRPDVVIVMNPIYRDEIHQDLVQMGLDAELLMVDS